MDKKKLLALIAKKNERKTALTEQADACEDVAQLRAMNAELDTLNEEIRSLQELADSIPDEADPDGRTAAVTGQVPGVVVAGATQRKAEPDDMEYRKAFQQFVTRGTPIPAELRDDATTATTDLTTAIPTVLVNQIVEKLEATGMILPLVTKTAFPAGMNIPTSSVKPVASWVAEGASSDKQKKEVKTAITFTHFKLRCEIAMTMESSVMAISAFEAKFVENVVEAMTKALEDAIINGAWNAGKTALVGPKGILNETVATGQNVDVAANAGLTYETLVDAEAKLPLAYENGAVWFMTKKTFMEFVAMTDTVGQPIARVNYGIGGKPERTLLGRTVVLNEYMPNYAATVTNDTVVAFLFNPKDYVLNTNYNMGIQRKQDWDTEDFLTKAVMAVDGKVVDKNSLVTITKKA
jgi:HK97 family phage major capsid protein